jgi:hypothetical protein
MESARRQVRRQHGEDLKARVLVRMTAMMTADVDDVDRAEGAMRGV